MSHSVSTAPLGAEGDKKCTKMRRKITLQEFVEADAEKSLKKPSKSLLRLVRSQGSLYSSEGSTSGTSPLDNSHLQRGRELLLSIDCESSMSRSFEDSPTRSKAEYFRCDSTEGSTGSETVKRPKSGIFLLDKLIAESEDIRKQPSRRAQRRKSTGSVSSFRIKYKDEQIPFQGNTLSQGTGQGSFRKTLRRLSSGSFRSIKNPEEPQASVVASKVSRRKSMSDITPFMSGIGCQPKRSCLKNRQSLPSMLQSKDRNKLQNSDRNKLPNKVSFRNIYIREYEQTAGDNPACSSGPPICLDWDYQQELEFLLDEYEWNRGPRRLKNSMRMCAEIREETLRDVWGVSPRVIRHAKGKVREIQQQRLETLNFMFTEKAQLLMEHTRKKLKRLMKRGSKEKEEETLWEDAYQFALSLKDEQEILSE